MALPLANIPIQSTAGAVRMKNQKGEVVMQKVKVARYVTGKRPDYAPDYSSGEDEDIEFGGVKKRGSVGLPQVKTEAEKDDRRLRRLQERQIEEADEEDEAADRLSRRRRLHEPEVIAAEESEEEEEEVKPHEDLRRREEMEESSEEEEELDEEEIERRRALIRQRARQQQMQDEELMEVEDEKSEGESEEESSEYEEYTDSDEEETGPRLKPVFVRKKDRVTIQERENQMLKEKELEVEVKKLAEERRKQTLKMVEDEARKEREDEKGVLDACDLLKSDDDNDEEEYEAWKIRELKRIKRDREERENAEKEQQEIERLRNMTEEERRQELRNNPKDITNKAVKGKYKFLQKYYHRGAFYLDEEDHVYKRNFSAPTLEDHFDKTILPKVMQVKNFGRSGRTKYTHLVDQDTTSFDSPWASDTAMNLKFHNTKGGGTKQVFDRPAVKRQ